MFYVKQMNNGHFYVLRTAAHPRSPALACERGGYQTKAEAEKALARDAAKENYNMFDEMKDEMKELLVRYAYEALLEDLVRRQRRIAAYKEQTSELASRPFMRGSASFDAWKKREERADAEHVSDAKRLKEIVALVEAIEEGMEKRTKT